MTKTLMSTESASLNYGRMLKYKALASAFSYPSDKNLFSEYDRLFRQKEIWLYGAEYIAENEFQRSNLLSDISGFYKAFGLQTDKDRPDFLVSELEFMYYLIHKEIKAPEEAKSSVCRDAAKKFFNEHLYAAAKKIAEKIISQDKSDFYPARAQELLEFLESEKKVFAK